MHCTFTRVQTVDSDFSNLNVAKQSALSCPVQAHKSSPRPPSSFSAHMPPTFTSLFEITSTVYDSPSLLCTRPARSVLNMSQSSVTHSHWNWKRKRVLVGPLSLSARCPGLGQLCRIPHRQTPSRTIHHRLLLLTRLEPSAKLSAPQRQPWSIVLILRVPSQYSPITWKARTAW